MKETERISRLFEELYTGHPWLDVTVMDTLKSLDADKAALKIKPGWNSIWEIVNHVISWKLAVMQRMDGHSEKSPDNNFFLPVSDTTASAWNSTIERLMDTEEKWLKFINKFSAPQLEEVPDVRPFTRYELIHGILQHDAYHLGQIRLLVKWIGEKQ